MNYKFYQIISSSTTCRSNTSSADQIIALQEIPCRQSCGTTDRCPADILSIIYFFELEFDIVF